jgi:hypothetical protein
MLLTDLAILRAIMASCELTESAGAKKVSAGWRAIANDRLFRAGRLGVLLGF